MLKSTQKMSSRRVRCRPPPLSRAAQDDSHEDIRIQEKGNQILREKYNRIHKEVRRRAAAPGGGAGR